MSSVRATVLAILAAAGLATPSAAEDCFVRVSLGEAGAVAPVRHHAPAAMRPRHLHQVHHIAHKPRPRPRQLIAAAQAPGRVGPSPVQRSIMRRVSCIVQPGLQSKAPRQRLLDALASPVSPPISAGSSPVVGPLADAAPVGRPDATTPFTGEPIGGPAPGGPQVLSPIVTPPGPPGPPGPPPVSPTPEPATWAMLLLGFAGAGSALRSRRRRLNVVKSK